MATIIYLDSSAAARTRAARLLDSHEQWQCIAVSRLSEVVERCRLHPVDAVVTELFLADEQIEDSARPADHAALAVTTLKEAFPSIPVIAVTNQGDEFIAAAVLRAGAADYVSKQYWDDHLLDAVERALESGKQLRSAKQVAKWVFHQTTQFRMQSDRDQAPILAKHLVEMGVACGVLRAEEHFREHVALEEALVNAVVHGNLEVSSKLRELDGDAFVKLIRLREVTRPYCDRHVEVVCETTRDSVRYTITDEGPGFDVASLPDPTSEEAILKPSGRGVLLMRAFMDDVQFNAKGNSVTLIQRRAPESCPETAEHPDAALACSTRY